VKNKRQFMVVTAIGGLIIADPIAVIGHWKNGVVVLLIFAAMCCLVLQSALRH
jgi:uncharacterized membrane protein